MNCFHFKLAVRTVTAVFQGANYCVKSAEGGPSTGSVLNSSGWVEPRRCFIKQLLNCLGIRTLTVEMVNLPIFIL